MRYGGPRIKDFTADGVRELPPFIINNHLPNAWSLTGVGRGRGGGLEQSVYNELQGLGDYTLQNRLQQVITWARGLWGLLPELRDILIYCEQGANRSAAGAMAVSLCGTGCTVDEVISSVRCVVIGIQDMNETYFSEMCVYLGKT